MPRLTLYFPETFADGVWAGLSYQLEVPGSLQNRSGEWLLGRHPGSDLTLNHRSISRRHAAISYSYAADGWSIQDLGSTQGTRVGQTLLEPGDWHPIKIGDRLWLGGNQINVVEDEEDTVPPDEVGPPTE
ncbi:MAG: FHA domain-containing protein, partial [Nodosilinea sp.]